MPKGLVIEKLPGYSCMEGSIGSDGCSGNCYEDQSTVAIKYMM